MPLYIVETEREIFEMEADNDDEALELAPPNTLRLYPVDRLDYLLIDEDLL